MMLMPKRWTSYRLLAASEGEIVASSQGGNSRTITNNKTSGVTSTMAAAKSPPCQK